MTTARDLSAMLANEAESIARMLLPAGKRTSGEWEVGSLKGEPGSSLRVRLTGTKAGVWCDFATNQSGDLLDLWRETRQLTAKEAIDAVKSYFGVQDEKLPTRYHYSDPLVPKCSKAKSEGFRWLSERGLSQNTIEAFKIAEFDHAGKVYVLFPYLGPDGKRRMLKQRCITDKKDQRPTSAGQEKCLFGWQAIPEHSRTVVICEGEIDAMSFHEWGIPALSVPFGGGGGAKQDWVENEFENLDRFDEIILAMDTDNAGREATKELSTRLGNDRVKVVELPHKDANECLLNGIKAEQIQRLIQAARPADPQELKGAAEFEQAICDRLYPKDTALNGFVLPWSKFNGNFDIRFGELTVLNGINGHGKSQGAGHIVISAIAQGYRACIASMELRPAILLEKLTKQAAGLALPSRPYVNKIVTQFFHDSLWIFECVGTAKSERILEVFRYARKRYGIRVFVIDSLMKCGFAEDDYNGQKRFIETLCDFKNEMDCHVILITHSKKKDDERTRINKFDVKGTGAITDLADNVVNWFRNKQKERLVSGDDPAGASMDDASIEAMPDAIVSVEKQRNGDWEGSIPLWFDRGSYQFLSRPNRPNYEYVTFVEGK